MTEHLNGNGQAGVPERLVVVRVEDAIEPKLTARTGASYESPPQPREQAMMLVRLLLGCDSSPAGESLEHRSPAGAGRSCCARSTVRERTRERAGREALLAARPDGLRWPRWPHRGRAEVRPGRGRCAGRGRSRPQGAQGGEAKRPRDG